MHTFQKRALTVLLSLFVFTATPAKAFELQKSKQFGPHCAPAESWELRIIHEFDGLSVIGYLPYEYFPFSISVMHHDIRDKTSRDAADGKWHICGYRRGTHQKPVIQYLLRPRPVI